MSTGNGDCSQNHRELGLDGNTLNEDSELPVEGSLSVNEVKMSCGSCDCSQNHRELGLDGDTLNKDSEIPVEGPLSVNEVKIKMSPGTCATCGCSQNHGDVESNVDGNPLPKSQVANSKDGQTSRLTPVALVVVGACLMSAPVTFPMAALAVGFGSTGIAAGSLASSIMASYGGVVTTGSACAVLQSVGAVGAIGGAGTVASLAAGGALTATGLSSSPTIRQEVFDYERYPGFQKKVQKNVDEANGEFHSSKEKKAA